MTNCKTCEARCIKKGFDKNGKQRFCCTGCNKYQLMSYSSYAWLPSINDSIKTLVKEGCGIRSIGRILKIASATVVARIKAIAKEIVKPALLHNKSYEVDELRTFVKKKCNLSWVVSAYERESKSVVEVAIGKRTTATLQKVTQTLLLACASKIHTDKLGIYNVLIPQQLHSTKARSINHVERFHLNLRTHLKRLARRSICFSKSALMLSCCLKIYLWG